MTEIIDLPADTASAADMYVPVYRASAGAQKSRRILRDDLLDDVARIGDDVSFDTATCLAVVAQNSLTVGAVVITAVKRGNLAVTASTLAAGATEDKTATLAGVASGDVVLFSIVGIAAGLTVHAWVSAADTITFRITNVSGGSVTGAAYTANVIAIRAA